jgi:hypothetical protein
VCAGCGEEVVIPLGRWTLRSARPAGSTTTRGPARPCRLRGAAAYPCCCRRSHACPADVHRNVFRNVHRSESSQLSHRSRLARGSSWADESRRGSSTPLPQAFGLADAFGLPAQMAILPSLVGQAKEQQRTRGPRLFLMLELYGLSSRSP